MTRELWDVPETTCPACGTNLDAYVSVTADRAPSVGDRSVCGHCGEQLVFGEKMILHRMTPEERAELSSKDAELMDDATRTIRLAWQKTQPGQPGRSN